MHPDAAQLFGRPELSVDGRRSYLAANQVHRFLAYLAFRAGWVPRDEVLFLFWPDRVDAVGRRNLRKLLHRARREVAGVEAEGDRIRWLVRSDVNAYREALGRDDAAGALASYGGTLLEGLDPGAPAEYAAWLERERVGLLDGLIDAVVARCRTLDRVDPQAAADLSAELLKVDPLDERSVRCCLRSMTRAGRPDGLDRVYRSYVRDLAEGLDVEPDEETRALYLALRSASRGSDEEDAAGEDVASAAASSPARAPAVPPRATAHWTTASFVGRPAESTQLREALASALAGQGGIVAVEGEAGVGKTRLIEELVANVPAGVRVFAARCYERDLSAPLEPLRTALGAWEPEAVARAPVDTPFATSEPRDPGNAHRALTARLVAEAAEGSGAVLVIDDLQWADAATLEFLSYAAQRVRDERVLIVVGHRREDRSGLERWRARLAERRAIRTVRLERFDPDQTRTLVAGIFDGSEAQLDRFVGFVHAESEGNPFYALEYLRWMRDSGVVQLDASQRIAAPDWERIASVALPESIRSLIWGRYLGFEDDARFVLDVAAVIGRSFGFDLMQGVVGGSPLALWSTFEPLIGAGLIVATPDGSYALSHDKLRQTVYESLGPPVVRALHARVAEALRASGAGDADLAHHSLRAERWPEAYEHLRLAARSAEADSAWEVAREGYARMLTLVDRLEDPDGKGFEALQAIERLLEYMGRRPEWIDTIERLTVLAERTGDPRMRAEAALKRMAMLSFLGDRAGAAEAFEKAGALFTDLGDAGSTARGHREVAYLAWIRGDYHEVLAASFEAIAIYRRLGHRRALAATAANVSHAYRWLGDVDEAERWAEEAASAYEALGDILADYVRLDIRAWGLLERGENEAAATVLERLLPICVRMEDKHLVVEKHMNLGKIHLESGRYEEALGHFEAATALGAATGDLRHEGYPLISVGVAREALGAYGDAARSYREAARLLEGSFAITGMSEDETGQGDALILHGRVVRRRLGESDVAMASLATAEAIFRRSGDAHRSGLVQMELGALHWAARDLGRAADSFREARDTADLIGLRERGIAARASLGVVYRELGRIEESIEVGHDALDRMAAGEDPRAAAYLLTSLATSYGVAGRAREARALFERSLALRRGLGDAAGEAAALRALAELDSTTGDAPAH